MLYIMLLRIIRSPTSQNSLVRKYIIINFIKLNTPTWIYSRLALILGRSQRDLTVASCVCDSWKKPTLIVIAPDISQKPVAIDTAALRKCWFLEGWWWRNTYGYEVVQLRIFLQSQKYWIAKKSISMDVSTRANRSRRWWILLDILLKKYLFLFSMFFTLDDS